MIRVSGLALVLLIYMCLLSTSVNAADSALCTGDTIPMVMAPQHKYTVSVIMQNNGTTTWTKSAGYRLGAAGDSDPFGPGRVDLNDNDAIRPGDTKTFTFTMTTPSSSNTYITDWQMLREGVDWFGDIRTKQVQVTWGTKPPAPPTVISPALGETIMSNRWDIIWSEVPNDYYQIRVCTVNSPDSGIVWDSGAVYQIQSTGCISGPLAPGKLQYMFIRLHNPNGWGNWSAYNYHFYVAGEFPGNSATPSGDPYLVAGEDGFQWPFATCYNPDRNEYLVCYSDARPWRKPVVSFYRLDGTGVRIGIENYVIDDLAGSGNPHVCYNSARKEYLIAYQGYTANQGLHNELRMQRVNAVTGALIGGSVWMRNTSVVVVTKVAYSPTSNCYLLVWEDSNDSPPPVYGLRLDTNAVPIGNVFHISDGRHTYAGNPKICYNSINNEFFVTFHSYRESTNPATEWDSYAQRVRASDGALLGPNIIISETLEVDWNSGVAYDSDLNRYLTIYEGGVVSPYGQFISASGTLVGSRFPIAEGYNRGGMANIAWNSNTKEYLATWAHNDSYANFARRLSQTGAYIGEPIRINGDKLGIGNWHPTPVYNPVNNDFLLCWFNSYDNVWVRRYKTYSTPGSDTTGPAAVTNFTATPGNEKLTISWKNPAATDYAGTVVCYRTDRYPTSPTDGLQIADKQSIPSANDSYLHLGLSGGTRYYYSAFAYDCWHNYSVAANVNHVPQGAAIINNSTFDSNPDGWNTGTWKSGIYSAGSMLWDGAVGYSGGGMHCCGYGATDNNSKGEREGGFIYKGISTANYRSIRLSYDLRVGSLGNAPGTPTGSGNVDHGDIQEQLTIYYSTDNGATWTEANAGVGNNWLNRATLLGYQNYGTRTIDFTGVSGVRDNAHFALKFRWQFNSRETLGDFGDLDNIKVWGSPAAYGSISDAKQSGGSVSLGGKVLYMKRGNFGYISEMDRTNGIRIEGNITANEGEVVYLSGTIGTTGGGEKYISVDTISADGSAVLKTLGAGNKDLGSSLLDGMYVCAWGIVKSVSATGNYFIMSDGYDSGIKVMTNGAPSVSEGQYVTVTGAAGYDGTRVIYMK